MKLFFFISSFFLNNNIKKYILHNYKYFTNKKKQKSKVLVEFNNWHPTHISYSYLSNFLAKKFNSSIISYPGYTLIAENLHKSIYRKIKFFIGKLFRLKTFGIYDSFGVEDFLTPSINKEIEIKSKNKIDKIKDTLNDKNKILSLNINNILIGDLIYDTYLAKKKIPTIDINSLDFYKFLLDAIKYFYYWEEYFNKNKITSIVTSHSVYTIAIPLRIAISKKIPSYVCSQSGIYNLTKKKFLCETEFFEYKKKFNQLSVKEKKIGLSEAKRRILLRLKGKVGVDMGYSTKSSFSKIKKNSVLKKNKKIKVLIATHCFLDAPNAMGRMLFADFFEWINFLGEFSKNTNYDWYIKTHPDFKAESHRIIKIFLKKYSHINLVEASTSHHQLKKEGINFALTCYGTIGFEYAMLNIPVINASINNPHISYNFNFHPKNLKEYKKLLNNLNNLKLNIKKKEIYEYYFMTHMYYSKNWLFNDLALIEKKAGGFRKIYNDKIYKIWLQEFSEKRHQKKDDIISGFIKSKDFRLNLKSSNMVFINELKKGRNIN